MVVKNDVDLAGRQRRGRLVEQQHGRLALEFAQQLDALLDPHRQRLDDRIRIDRQPVRRGQLLHAAARRADVDPVQPRLGSRPSRTFSQTRKRSTSSKCWCTRPTTPSAATLPSSARTAPKAIAASVDFPAPFSPTSAWISPG